MASKKRRQLNGLLSGMFRKSRNRSYRPIRGFNATELAPNQIWLKTTESLEDRALLASVIGLDADVSEIAESGGIAVLTATLDQPDFVNDISVILGFSGSAAFNLDYTASAVITIPSGAISSSVLVSAVADLEIEGDEVVVADVVGVVNGTETGDQQASVSIIDDDAFIQLSASPTTVTEAGETVTFTASVVDIFGAPATAPVDIIVDFGLGGTATPLVDYGPPVSSVAIPAGLSSADVHLLTFDDLVAEGTETALLEIVNVTGGVENGIQEQLITITDNDVPALTLSIQDAAVNEIDGVAATIGTVTRNTVNTSHLDVTIISGDPGEAAAPATVRIPAGGNSASFLIGAVNDMVLDGTQTVGFTAQAPGLSDGTASLDVLDSTYELTLDVSTSAATEAAGTVVTLTATATDPVIGNQNVEVDISGAGITSGDYTLSNSIISIPNGQTQGTVTFTVIDDNLVEAATETVTFNLINPSVGVAVAGNGTRDITIQDNDSATISIDDVTLAEGDAGTTAFVFTITMSTEVDTPILLDASTVDGTAAAADNDYTAVVAAPVGFAANGGSGLLTRTLAVQVTGDSKVELDEDFVVSLDNLVTAGRDVTFLDPTGRAVITNDDAATVSISDVTADEGDSGTTFFTFNVTLDAEVDTDVTLNLDTQDGTALVADSDYSPIAALPLTLSANVGGPQTIQVGVEVQGDANVEADETFLVNLSNLANGTRDVSLGTSSATGNIVNDDIASISITDETTAEGDTGNTSLIFVVTLDANVSTPVSVDFDVVHDTTSIADGDISAAVTSGTLNFNGTAGETQQVTVDVVGDEKVELDERFFVNLSNLVSGPGVQLADAQGVGTITNDDAAEISIADVGALEANGGFSSVILTVTLDQEIDTPLLLTYNTADGTALASDNDYVASTGTVSFADNNGPGVQTRTLAVQVNGDQKVELDESFGVDLSGISVGGRQVTFASDKATVTVANDDAAQVSVADVTVAEGNTAASLLTFTVTLDAEVDAAIDVDYATSEGTASLADGDYDADTSGSISFAANSGGPQTQTFSVNVNGDDKVELDETILASLSSLNASGLNVSIGAAQAAGTIANDDVANLSIGDATLTEGDSGTSIAAFTVSLDGEIDSAVVANYSTTSGTAQSGEDFVPITAGNITFVTGVTTQQQTVEISVNGDQKVELDETFSVVLSNGGFNGLNITFTDGNGLGTIQNDDSATVIIDDVSLPEGDSGLTQFLFNVTLSNEVDVPVVVDFASAEDTATVADVDFDRVVNGSLQFDPDTGAGSQTKTISVNARGDGKVELNESFLVVLSNLISNNRSVTIADAQGTGTIENDDSGTITVSDVSLSEGLAGRATLVFGIVLDSEVDAPIMVDAATSDNSATIADGDYLPSGTVTFTFDADAGAFPQSRTLSVQVNDDSTVELDESLLVSLSNLVANGRDITIANAQALGMIINDDGATLKVGDVTTVEGDSGSKTVTFTASLDANVDVPFTVDYSTADGTATAGADYAAASGTLSFNGTAGESRTLSVEINGDETVETDESFFLTLSALLSAGRDIGLVNSDGVGTISNDDSATITISDAAVVEGQQGTTPFNFLVTLSGNVDVPLTVDYSTQDDTATAGSDYTAIPNGQLNFDGTTNETHTITVLVNGDDLVEMAETFFVDLNGVDSGGRNVTILDNRGIGTIGNEDTVIVTINDAVVTEGHSPNSSFLTFEVTRSNTTVPVDIEFRSIDGTATVADGDYIPVSRTLSFPAGSPASGNIVIEVLSDHVTESSETLFVELSSSSNGVVFPDNMATGTILHDDGFVTGQKWYDRNGDGIKDADERGLDGWVIQIVNDRNEVVTEGVTVSVDLNGDNIIDPFTEQGLYSIPTGAGDWFVREVLKPGWQQTFPRDGNDLAYQLDQQLGLESTGTLFEDWGGLGEKWLYNGQDWFYITPAGKLYQWDGSSMDDLSGQLIATLDSRFHTAPSLLYDAKPGGQIPVSVAIDQTITGIDFGNLPTGSIEGRKWHDANANGERDGTEPWLNGWEVTLRNSAGKVIGTAITGDLDRNGNGTIDPESESGWFRFSNLVPDTYRASEEFRTRWTQSGSDVDFVAEVYELNEQKQFREPLTDFLDWGGRDEKWLWSHDGWHFVTPDGSIYKWDNSPREALTGDLITLLDPSYYNDLSRLYAPAQPRIYDISIVGDEVTGIDFGNWFGHDGNGQGNVNVSINGADVSAIGDDLANSLSVFADNAGNTVILGVGGTLINGGTEPVVVTGGASSFSASMGGGFDQVSVHGVSLPGGLNVESGAGNDMVIVGHVDAGGTGINIGNAGGDDTRRVIGSSASSLSATGPGLASLEMTQVNGGLNVAASRGVTTVVVEKSTVGSDTNIDLGSASDVVIANKSNFNGLFSVDTSEGHDLTALYANDFQGQADIVTRAGNDTTGFRNGNSFSGSGALKGGAGTDTVASDGSGQLPQNSIERNDNSFLDSLVDQALSSYQDLNLDF